MTTFKSGTSRSGKMKSKRQGLVTSYGRLWARNDQNFGLWARNDQNFEKLGDQGKLKGLYILYDGSMSVYVGHGWILKSP